MILTIWQFKFSLEKELVFLIDPNTLFFSFRFGIKFWTPTVCMQFEKAKKFHGKEIL